MRKFKSLSVLILIMSFVLLASSFSTALAEDQYPNKRVEVIVPWSAGGSTDVMVRMLNRHLEDELGVEFLTINRSGAGGEIGWTELSMADPDGYTMGAINIPNFTAKYIEKESTKFDLSTIEPIANIVTDPGVLVVSADSEIKTLEDFKEYAQENNGNVTISHEGVGGDDYIATRKIEREMNIELNRIQYDGNAPARAALLGGHVDVNAINASEAIPYQKSGDLRILAIMADERLSSIPDVSTFEEKGYDIINNSSRGIIAPAGTPQEKIKIITEALRKVVQKEEFLEKAKEANFNIDFIASKEYNQFLNRTEKEMQELWDEDPWTE